MKLHQKINQFFWQVFSVFLILIFILIHLACPKPPSDNIDCGTHQVEVNGNCECEEGYHWNEDQTKCLMDTTSHNFTWVIDTLGDYGSYLNDVAIIDENNIWVVGNIETDSGEYNAAHWDGIDWDFLGLGSNTLNLNSIYYFSENDIWVCSGIPRHWNGQEWIRYNLWDMGVLSPNEGGVSKLWGSSSDNIYFAGGNGSIVHYDGIIFTKMESGIEESIIDIWGLDENHIWAVTHKNDGSGIINEVLFYDGNVWSIIHEKTNDNWPPTDYTKPSGTFNSVWAYEDTVYISCAGLYKESIHTGEGVLVPLVDMHWQLGWGTGNVRGINYNDIVVTTSFGSEISHYNGKDWKFYEDLNAFDIHDFITTAGLAIKNDMIVIVGEDLTTSKAMVYRGYR